MGYCCACIDVGNSVPGGCEHCRRGGDRSRRLIPDGGREDDRREDPRRPPDERPADHHDEPTRNQPREQPSQGQNPPPGDHQRSREPPRDQQRREPGRGNRSQQPPTEQSPRRDQPRHHESQGQSPAGEPNPRNQSPGRTGHPPREQQPRGQQPQQGQPRGQRAQPPRSGQHQQPHSNQPRQQRQAGAGGQPPRHNQQNEGGGSRRGLLLGLGGLLAVGAGGWWVWENILEDDPDDVAEEFVEAVDDADWETAGDLTHPDSGLDDGTSFAEMVLGELPGGALIEFSVDALDMTVEEIETLQERDEVALVEGTLEVGVDDFTTEVVVEFEMQTHDGDWHVYWVSVEETDLLDDLFG